MVETLRKIMPHTAVIREVYGIDVWKNLAEYRNKISEKNNTCRILRPGSKSIDLLQRSSPFPL